MLKMVTHSIIVWLRDEIKVKKNWFCWGPTSPSSKTFCELEEVKDETHFQYCFIQSLLWWVMNANIKQSVFLKFQDVLLRAEWRGCLILMHIRCLVLFLNLRKDVSRVYLFNITMSYLCCHSGLLSTVFWLCRYFDIQFVCSGALKNFMHDTIKKSNWENWKESNHLWVCEHIT